MALSTDRIGSIRNTISERPDPLQDLEQNVSSAVKDPFGAVITKVVTKIGQLSVVVEGKIDDLTKKIIESADATGKVSLQGNTIVITVSKENAQQAEQLKRDIDIKIKSVQTLLNTLQVTLTTLQTVQTGIDVLRTALSIQEIALSANPVSGPIFQVIKQGVKLIFLKDMIKEYSAILKRQLKTSNKEISKLSNRFRNLQVSIKVQEEKDKGNIISTSEAEDLLAQQLLDTGTNQEGITSTTEEYLSPKNIEYLLKVEKYQEKQLIAVAYEKESGMIKQQTSPSFFATPEELLSELKAILNINS